MIERVGLWPMRLVWLMVPATIGPALGAALADHSGPVRVTVMALAWGGWATGLLAVLIPRSIGLTGLRLIAPTAVGFAGWVGVDDGASTGLRAVALVGTLVACFVAFAPSTGEHLVDGSSYGDERRVLLRAPAALWFGPLPLAWAALAAMTVGGPVLVAARQWVLGSLVVACAIVAGRVLVARFHQLSRRWLVFVPAGVVVHDPFTLAEPVLFPRRLVGRFGPAPLDNAALDLTGGAAGLALELSTVEPIEMAPVRRGEDLTTVGVQSILVTPTRPGHTLELAADRRLPIG